MTATLKLDQSQFSDLLNLTHNVFYPLKNFVNKSEYEQIILYQKFKKFFFPFPILFGITKKNFLKIKNSKKIRLIYKKKDIVMIDKVNFFFINKISFGKKIYGPKYKSNPFFKKFFSNNYIKELIQNLPNNLDNPNDKFNSFINFFVSLLYDPQG